MNLDNPEFNLAAFETADSSTLTVLSAKGDELQVNGKTVTITLHGPGTKVQVAADRKRQKAAKSVLFAGIGGRVTKNAEEEEFQREAEYLAACTISIENFPVAPLALYQNTRLGYITKQVQKHLADEANFTTSSPQS